jgi:hypothetical protein
VISSISPSRSGSGWRVERIGFLLLSRGWAEQLKDQWWAADLHALEASDRAVHAHDRGALVRFDDDAAVDACT